MFHSRLFNIGGMVSHALLLSIVIPPAAALFTVLMHDSYCDSYSARSDKIPCPRKNRNKARQSPQAGQDRGAECAIGPHYPRPGFRFADAAQNSTTCVDQEKLVGLNDFPNPPSGASTDVIGPRTDFKLINVGKTCERTLLTGLVIETKQRQVLGRRHFRNSPSMTSMNSMSSSRIPRMAISVATDFRKKILALSWRMWFRWCK